MRFFRSLIVGHNCRQEAWRAQKMKRYKLYGKDDATPVMTFQAKGHVRDLGLTNTISLYGVSAKDQSEIDKYVSPSVQPPNERRGRLYKILPKAPDIYTQLAEKTTIGDVVKFKRAAIGQVEDEVSRLVSDAEYKYFLQKIRLYDQKAKEFGSRYGYRWCYWTLADDGLIRFGQFALLLSDSDLLAMLTEARSKGWPI